MHTIIYIPLAVVVRLSTVAPNYVNEKCELK
jgi:hypothetical protein